MSKAEKIFEKVMSGSSDTNIRFDDLCALLTKLGFDSRQKGTSHKVFDLGESFLNVQAGRGGKAKPYQVAQVRAELKRANIRL